MCPMQVLMQPSSRSSRDSSWIAMRPSCSINTSRHLFGRIIMACGHISRLQRRPHLQLYDLPRRRPQKIYQMNWPQPIAQATLDARLSAYRDGINVKVAETCAVCARRSFDRDLLFVKHTVRCQRVDAETLALHHLQITDPFIKEKHLSSFHFGHKLVDGLALDRSGVHIIDGRVQLDICKDCRTALVGAKSHVPALSLANGNIRGELPEDLQDGTWLEERLCARVLASAYIAQLNDVTAPSAPEYRARVLKGHGCSFPLNVISTSAKLPRAFSDGSLMVSVVVIGPRRPRIEDLRRVFKVRRAKVQALLLWLRDNCKDYPAVSIDEAALAELPEDDVSELLHRQIIYQESKIAPSLFATDTSSLEPHPALEMDDDDEEPRTYLEHHGILDINGVRIPSHERETAALLNATGGPRPDLILRHGSEFISSYDNPALFPSMYPTLYP
ncbi:hypothetical protein V8E36_001103 [Tilletia maclaganii]